MEGSVSSAESYICHVKDQPLAPTHAAYDGTMTEAGQRSPPTSALVGPYSSEVDSTRGRTTRGSEVVEVPAYTVSSAIRLGSHPTSDTYSDDRTTNDARAGGPATPERADALSPELPSPSPRPHRGEIEQTEPFISASLDSLNLLRAGGESATPPGASSPTQVRGIAQEELLLPTDLDPHTSAVTTTTATTNNAAPRSHMTDDARGLSLTEGHSSASFLMHTTQQSVQRVVSTTKHVTTTVRYPDGRKGSSSTVLTESRQTVSTTSGQVGADGKYVEYTQITSPATKAPELKPPARRKSVPKQHRLSDSASRRANGAVVPAKSSSKASKNLFTPVETGSISFELRDILEAIDFAAVLAEFRAGSSPESTALEQCRHLFRIIAKNKDALSAEDVYDLLVLFTPCGASLREGVDFLWENCEESTSLPIEQFLEYGPRLRARLRGYELFTQLSDHDKLLMMYARVLPREPAVKANEARWLLLKAADQQLRGQLPPDTRPLRLYEELFLVAYQAMLYEVALVPASEMPGHRPDGDYAHEFGGRGHASPPMGFDGMVQRERMDWCNGTPDRHARSNKNCSSGGSGGGQRSLVPYTGDDATPKGVSKRGRRGRWSIRPYKSENVYDLATGRRSGAETAHTLYMARGSYVSRSGSPHTSPSERRPPRHAAYPKKNIGRFIEDEYWERRTLDDHLLTQLQDMYSTR